MENEVLEFINRRFNKDCNWINGNCYYFAIILKERFPNAIILYDIIDGHFISQIDNHYYDWTGEIKLNPNNYYIEWDRMDEYDSNVKNRIIRDCIK